MLDGNANRSAGLLAATNQTARMVGQTLGIRPFANGSESKAPVMTEYQNETNNFFLALALFMLHARLGIGAEILRVNYTLY